MTENTTQALKPLDIKCTATRCADGLHCFRATRKMLKRNEGGACRACGARLIDWPRVHQNNLSDAPHTIRMLQHELIRHHFWHTPLDQRALNYARRKGTGGLLTAIENRLRKAVATRNPAYDGRQTPKSGNPVFYAQHATASCCRKCIEEWHGIPSDRVLTEAELTYLTELCALYLLQRLPDLKADGEHVPPIKAAKTTSR